MKFGMIEWGPVGSETAKNVKRAKHNKVKNKYMQNDCIGI